MLEHKLISTKYVSIHRTWDFFNKCFCKNRYIRIFILLIVYYARFGKYLKMSSTFQSFINE